jgi:hypothetical protein
LPFLHSRLFQRLFSSVRPFRVSCSTLLLVEYFLTKFPLCHATPAKRVVFLLVTNSFCCPQFTWVKIFLMMFLLCDATLAGGSERSPRSTVFLGPFFQLSAWPAASFQPLYLSSVLWPVALRHLP